MLPAVDDLAKLGSPVTDMIVGDNLMTEMTGNSSEGVTKNRAPDMANVHRLGNIRGAKIDDDGLPLLNGFHAEMPITPDSIDGIGKGCIQDLKIDESSSSHRG